MKTAVHIQKTLTQLLQQEDTDHDKKITIDDQGPKSFSLIDIHTGKTIIIEGTYYLSNLLQELALLQKQNVTEGQLDLNKIFEAPTDRISRKIKEEYWTGLTRCMDEQGIEKIVEDEKTHTDRSYLYVSEKDIEGLQYYQSLAQKFPKLEIIALPEHITPELDFSLNKKPGLLALDCQNKNGKISGKPFVVPGGRFNEMYGWDSYFMAIGLLLDGKIEMAKNLADHFEYQIHHYGKILNANRSYYLSRTQPPFYSRLVVDILTTEKQPQEWIEHHLKGLIDEYETVWMTQESRLTPNGLNRYKAEGIGMPFEVEPGHFDDILQVYANKHQLPLREFEKQYLNQSIIDNELDKYFIHDRSMRESGHDTTHRFVNLCASLNCIDINALLYQYEKDIAYLIQHYYNGEFTYNNKVYTHQQFTDYAHKRKELVNQYLWNDNKGVYLDYDFINQQQKDFISAMVFVPLWSQMANEDQAKSLVENILPQLTMKGGIAGCTEASIKDVPEEPIRQWDYPYGWAPHQMVLWKGLQQYGYQNKLQEMVYRWLWLITKNAVDYNGTIPEKFDLKTSSHKVFAEYGNVGTEFSYITEEGFGWMNASYQYGLSLLEPDLRQKLNFLTDPDTLFKRKE